MAVWVRGDNAATIGLMTMTPLSFACDVWMLLLKAAPRLARAWRFTQEAAPIPATNSAPNAMPACAPSVSSDEATE